MFRLQLSSPPPPKITVQEVLYLQKEKTIASFHNWRFSLLKPLCVINRLPELLVVRCCRLRRPHGYEHIDRLTPPQSTGEKRGAAEWEDEGTGGLSALSG